MRRRTGESRGYLCSKSRRQEEEEDRGYLPPPMPLTAGRRENLKVTNRAFPHKFGEGKSKTILQKKGRPDTFSTHCFDLAAGASQFTLPRWFLSRRRRWCWNMVWVRLMMPPSSFLFLLRLHIMMHYNRGPFQQPPSLLSKTPPTPPPPTKSSLLLAKVIIGITPERDRGDQRFLKTPFKT